MSGSSTQALAPAGMVFWTQEEYAARLKAWGCIPEGLVYGLVDADNCLQSVFVGSDSIDKPDRQILLVAEGDATPIFGSAQPSGVPSGLPFYVQTGVQIDGDADLEDVLWFWNGSTWIDLHDFDLNLATIAQVQAGAGSGLITTPVLLAYLNSLGGDDFLARDDLADALCDLPSGAVANITAGARVIVCLDTDGDGDVDTADGGAVSVLLSDLIPTAAGGGAAAASVYFTSTETHPANNPQQKVLPAVSVDRVVMIHETSESNGAAFGWSADGVITGRSDGFGGETSHNSAATVVSNRNNATLFVPAGVQLTVNIGDLDGTNSSGPKVLINAFPA